MNKNFDKLIELPKIKSLIVSQSYWTCDKSSRFSSKSY